MIKGKTYKEDYIKGYIKSRVWSSGNAGSSIKFLLGGF